MINSLMERQRVVISYEKQGIHHSVILKIPFLLIFRFYNIISTCSKPLDFYFKYNDTVYLSSLYTESEKVSYIWSTVELK